MRKVVLVCTFFSVLSMILLTPLYAQQGAVFGPQSSNKYLEWNFDFVETFDGLKDWIGVGHTVGSGNVWLDRSPDGFPKNLDGTKSNWDYYSMWKTSSGDNWIQNHGPENVWRGKGKSLLLDLGDTGRGPSRFGLYFGDGTPESGYDDIYIFHMVKISKKEWPTHVDAQNVGSYYGGVPYYFDTPVGFQSWKFGTLNMGRDGQFHYEGVPQAYSPYHIIPHIKKYNYAPVFGKMVVKVEPNDSGGSGLGRSGYWGKLKSIEDFLPGWWGVEFHFKNIQDGGQNFTEINIWIYDVDGNSWHVLDSARNQYTTQPSSHKWNEWYFGGNNSNTYRWGPTMESPYYVDDFIINGSRIGKRYFAILYGNPYFKENDSDSLHFGENQHMGFNFGSNPDVDNSYLELTDNINYDSSTIFLNQSILSLSDSLIEFSANTGGLSRSGEYYLFYTNQAGLRNQEGYPVYVPAKLVTTVKKKTETIPAAFQLFQNYPNPFNPTTLISYTIAEQSNVFLAVYNVRGQLVRILVNGVVQPGENQVQWNGRDDSGQLVPSGIYFYKLKTKSVVLSRKMLFLK